MILIVDDDPAIRHSLSFLLACEGLDSRTFADARQLLAETGLSNEDFLITDVDLPGIDGIELLVRLRERGLNLPAVVMTGHPSSFVRQRAVECGAKAFLEKPIKAGVLLDLLHPQPHAS